MLEKLNKNVCYCDTNSVMYIESEQTKEIVDKYIGDGLGDWTDKLEGVLVCCSGERLQIFIKNRNSKEKVKRFKVTGKTEKNDKRAKNKAH